jgi:hypothetical protein
MEIDHRAHLLRIALEIAQLFAVISTLVLLAKTGFNVRTAGALVAAALTTALLARTPRPPLTGRGR